MGKTLPGRLGAPNFSKPESAALRKVGRKGGTHVLPSSLVTEETYAAPLEQRDWPPSMRKKRKLGCSGVVNVTVCADITQANVSQK